MYRQWESLYTDGKGSTHQMYDFGFSRRFVLVRVAYLSSSEAYTYNSGVCGKLPGFRLVETFYVNIKAVRSYDQFNTTT